MVFVITIRQSKSVYVGVSGGVDSSVALLLLQQQQYQLHGVFMKNWEADDTDEYCAAAVDLADAESVCSQLKIPLDSVNFSDQYWDRVFEYFLSEYKAGRTPNPDVLCNKEIKFKAFLDYALSKGADYVAMGHYARVKKTADEYQLLKAKDSNKDQSYFLHLLNQHQLSKSLFPLGDLNKTHVRQLATDNNFITQNKKDSTGICFIGERRFKDFLQQFIPAQRGIMQTPDGTEIGHHDGLMYYTIGQRKGLHIGGKQQGDGSPWYVADKLIDKNILVVVQGNEHALLYKKTLTATKLHWISGNPPELPYKCKAKTRYRQEDEVCTITDIDNDKCTVKFENPQWAITPGQSVVFYNGDICLGGGIIDNDLGLFSGS